jgi:hypothetical protein
MLNRIRGLGFLAGIVFTIAGCDRPSEPTAGDPDRRGHPEGDQPRILEGGPRRGGEVGSGSRGGDRLAGPGAGR